MSEISIQIPPLDEIEHHIEIEVKINGKKRLYNYRVEPVKWDVCIEPPEERALCLKRVIENYDNRWRLVQIGTPTETAIPIMFRERVN